MAAAAAAVAAAAAAAAEAEETAAAGAEEAAAIGAAAAEAAATAMAAAVARIAELEVVRETEAIRAEPSGYEESEVEVTVSVTGEDVLLERGGRLRIFIRSLLRTLLGVFHRLRKLLSFGSESADSSEPAAGTTSLQIEEERKLIAEPPSPESRAYPGTEWTPASSASEAHILVVDDAEGDRQVLSTILVRGGFVVSEADDGSTALALLDDAEGIDAILLDLQMNEMDGLAMLETIRKSKKTRAVPVVILTGSQDPGDERRLLQAGADDYLRKPVDPFQLIDRIRAVLRRAQL